MQALQETHSWGQQACCHGHSSAEQLCCSACFVILLLLLPSAYLGPEVWLKFAEGSAGGLDMTDFYRQAGIVQLLSLFSMLQ